MPDVTRVEHLNTDKVQLAPGDDLEYQLTVDKGVHPTWTFGCQDRKYIESDGGVPQDEYDWELRYEELDQAREPYTVTMGFVGPSHYHLLVNKRSPQGTTTPLQDIEYSLDDGTDYEYEPLIVEKR
jgi:hypothetical protein